MHIPDGYLSPSTCATLYVAAAPFWYVAFKRVKSVLRSQSVPLLALFAAFSFVVMMFNLPLPGGTTGHAVGMGMAAIVLGPWVSILAISMALLIQALFFGDGGITAFGANSLNMAIIGSLVAYGTYRLLSLGADIRSTRRVIAAGFAGYTAINVAALCAAVEFGIQPLLFRDASGAPLYAPYPLHIAIPAMMIGHLTFAGLAEFVLTAGLVRFLQRTDVERLRFTAGKAPELMDASVRPGGSISVLTSRRLWMALGLGLLLTPLGIVAIGSAWGEWTPNDLSNKEVRQQIAAASQGQAPPPQVPAGLHRLSEVWSAPLSRYAPRFVPNPWLGYLLCALIGAGLIVFFIRIVTWLAVRSNRFHGRRSRSFIERTIAKLLTVLQESFFADDISRSQGFLQALDPRVKLTGICGLILAVIAVTHLEALAVLFGLAVVLAWSSHVSLLMLIKRVWVAVFLFTGMIALPSLFLVPGQTLVRVPVLHWAVTSQGLRGAEFLLLRAETAATFSMLLIVCTPWNRLLRALRFCRAPAILVLMVEMAHRYIFLLLNVFRDMLESREARHVGKLEPAEQRRLAAATTGVLLDKSLKLSEEVYAAMLARGYRGEVHLLDDLHLTSNDAFHLVSLLGITCLVIWWGR